MNYFPMFADLRGRPVLVVGGGTVAERKIQSLLDAGAKVLLAARELTENLQTWAEEGRICRIAESFSDGLIRQAVLVIAATDDEELNRRVADAAERGNKLVNVVDRQELCSFIVPAVIDRSPIQIAVSSGSACTSASLEPSYVLRALGRNDELAHSSLRITFGRMTSEEDMKFAAELIKSKIGKLRELSPLWEMFKEGIDLDSVEWAAH